MENKQNIKDLVQKFYPYAKNALGFEHPVRVIMRHDAENAKHSLAKTAYYDPENNLIVLYVTNRHPKDILRSFSHELVHHAQNCRGEFDYSGDLGEDYFQNDPHMHEMELEAYKDGNRYFRMWEEKYREQLQESIYYTGEKTMKRIDSRRNSLNSLLMEKYGYKLNEAHCSEDELGEAHCSEELELEEEKMPDKNKDGIPDFAQDGKGKNDLGKAKGVDDSDEEEETDEDSDENGDLSKVPPQLRKHVAKKKKVSETQLRTAIREAIKQHFSKE